MKLDEFMEKVEILGKEFSMYVDDEKGVSFPLNTVHLLTRVDMLELAKEEYQVAKFQKKIDDQPKKKLRYVKYGMYQILLEHLKVLQIKMTR